MISFEGLIDRLDNMLGKGGYVQDVPILGATCFRVEIRFDDVVGDVFLIFTVTLTLLDKHTTTSATTNLRKKRPPP